MAAASPYVEMFVWFTIRDSPATWQSGFFQRGGSKKPSYAVFSAAAKKIVGQTQQVEPGRKPTVKVFVPFIAYHDARGTTVHIKISVYLNGKKLAADQQVNTKLSVDQSVSFLLNFKPLHGKQYAVVADVSDIHAQHDKRVVVLQTS
jgi:hypothetical protein